MSRTTWLAALALVCCVARCSAFDPVTHVWIAQQVLDDAADGGVSILGDEYPLPERSARVLRQHPAEYRMGSIGPDAVPDVLTGQATAHAGVAGGWRSDDWLRHVQQAAEADSPEALAFALGCWSHAAADVFAHTYVNRYTGATFGFRDRESTADTRHVVLERFIARHTPAAAPWDAVALPVRFVARTLVLDERADAQYARVPAAQLPRAMGALERALRRVPALAGWHAKVVQAVDAYVRANTDVVRNLMRAGHPDPAGPLREWARRWAPVLVGVPEGSRLRSAAGRALAAVKPVLGGLRSRLGRMAEGDERHESRILQATAELARALGDRWHRSRTMQHVELLRSPDTEEALARIFAESSASRSLPTYRDIARRVRADMGVQPGGRMTPESFAPAYNAVVLSKLALLDSTQLNALARKHGAGEPFAPGRLSLLDRAVRSLDASEQWRQPGFVLWSDARPLFCKLFRFPLARGRAEPDECTGR